MGVGHGVMVAGMTGLEEGMTIVAGEYQFPPPP